MIENDLLERLRSRARRGGTTISAELEAAVAHHLADEHPNAGLLALIGWGESTRDWPPVDSEDSEAERLHDLEKEAMGHGSLP